MRCPSAECIVMQCRPGHDEKRMGRRTMQCLAVQLLGLRLQQPRREQHVLGVDEQQKGLRFRRVMCGSKFYS